MPGDNYGNTALLRVAGVPGAWTPFAIPQGAKDALLTIDNPTASWRVTPDASIPLGTGTFIGASAGITWSGTATAPSVLYFDPSAPTVLNVLYVVDH